MKERYNSYLPLWFLLVMPPLVLILLCFNFIMSAVGLLISLFMLGTPDAFTKYSKNVFKVFGITLLLDFVSFILLLIPEFFHKVSFVQENLIYPLEHNPYSTVVSTIYILGVFLIVISLAYLLIKNKIVNKMDETKKKKRLVKVMLTLFVIPYLFFVPSSLFIKEEKSTLEDFRGTIIGNKSDIVNILRNLNVSEYINSYVLIDHKEPYTIYVSLKDIEYNHLMMFESDASVILALVDDVNEVIFKMSGKEYKYNINDINEIFGDVKKKSLTAIEERYSNIKFDNYIYYGRLNGYDVFDISEVCEENLEKIYEATETIYYIECSTLDNIKLYKKGEVISLSTVAAPNVLAGVLSFLRTVPTAATIKVTPARIMDIVNPQTAITIKTIPTVIAAFKYLL